MSYWSAVNFACNFRISQTYVSLLSWLKLKLETWSNIELIHFAVAALLFTTPCFILSYAQIRFAARNMNGQSSSEVNMVIWNTAWDKNIFWKWSGINKVFVLQVSDVRSTTAVQCRLYESVSMDNLPFDPWKENHPSQPSFFSETPLFTLQQVN